jgi:hypothetical protein
MTSHRRIASAAAANNLTWNEKTWNNKYYKSQAALTY